MTSDVPTSRRVLGIGAASAVMLLGILAVARFTAPAVGLPEETPPGDARTSGKPIAQEARPFEVTAADLAVAPLAEPRRGARRRTLADERRLRAFPGAPPRIPHEITARDQRDPTCLACHARGGYAPRFGAYAPVTPHAELESCTQCHVPDGTAPLFVGIDWRAASWPAIPEGALPEGPPPIPHDLQMRERCLTCHGGPAAPEEIRTTHPERSYCRQCHVPAGEGEAADVFTRPLDGTLAGPGGGR